MILLIIILVIIKIVRLCQKFKKIKINYKCPYTDCKKIYGSDVSLNLHIKLKHNGGNKS